MRQPAYNKGFTLLELLVALTICVFIGIGAHAMLKSVINAQEAAKKHSQALTQLQKAMWVMTQDIEQVIPRSMAIPSGNYAASFTREGWSNPLGLPRSDMLHVSYALEGTALKRYYWSADGGDTTPQTQTLVMDVSNFALRSLSPLAVEITFTSATFGTLRRVVEMPQP